MEIQLTAYLLIGEKGKRNKLDCKLVFLCWINILLLYIYGNRPEHPNGAFLVICCEGNAGFYEVGVIGTPLEAGYSVLGWNHPGFGGSTVRICDAVVSVWQTIVFSCYFSSIGISVSSTRAIRH